MLSPAQPQPQPQPAPAPPGKKCIIFRFVFRQRYSRIVKSCCSKIEKIKLVDPPNFQWKSRILIEKIRCFWSNLEISLVTWPEIQFGFPLAISDVKNWIRIPACRFLVIEKWWKITYFDRKNTVFLIHSLSIFGDVIGNPIWISAPWLLDDFFMFFACFLTHCKTGVLIFWRSIWMKNHVIFACFSRAFWLIARPRCWFFDDQYRRKIVLFSCVFRVLSDRLQDRRVDFFVLRGASGSSTLRTT